MHYPDVVKGTLDKIVAMVGDLPAAPAVVNAAMGMTADLETKISDLSRVLALDQSLTAKVLRLSNSPYYGRRQAVQTLHEAVIVLGFRAVRTLLIAASSHGMYTSEEAGEAGKKLWRHSLATAVAARQIAAHLKHPAKEEVFIAGLLHDIGKLVMIERMNSWYRKVIEEVESKAESFRRVESRVFRFNHCDVASVLLTDWSFPEDLIDAVAAHHRPSSYREGSSIPMAQIVNLGNYMAKIIDVGFKDLKVEDLSKLKSAQLMLLDSDILDKICEEFQVNYYVETKIIDEA